MTSPIVYRNIEYSSASAALLAYISNFEGSWNNGTPSVQYDREYVELFVPSVGPSGGKKGTPASQKPALVTQLNQKSVSFSGQHVPTNALNGAKSVMNYATVMNDDNFAYGSKENISEYNHEVPEYNHEVRKGKQSTEQSAGVYDPMLSTLSSSKAVLNQHSNNFLFTANSYDQLLSESVDKLKCSIGLPNLPVATEAERYSGKV